MKTKQRLHFLNIATAVAVALALVFSFFGLAAPDSSITRVSYETIRHAELQSVRSDSSHVHVDGEASEKIAGHVHEHQPDHSHEVPAILERQSVKLFVANQRWLLLLADHVLSDRRLQLERPPRLYSFL
ncbi:hypothetical protein [Pseudochrobactrum lubricantis]|uniref:hypothetical protein n=1 Tax=Pseudochrobactrum lubricantis TaxID=558172 RepID=UPI0035DB4F68